MLSLMNHLTAFLLLFSTGHSFTSNPTIANFGHRRTFQPVTTTTTSLRMSASPKIKNPIVLIGCSGAGDEIHRLASSLANGLVGDDKNSASDILRQLNNPNSEEAETGVVEVIHVDGNGPFVLAPSDIDSLISKKKLTSNDVITLDYSHALFTLEGGKYKDALISAFESLVKSLSQSCITVYVNVHPEEGLMNPTSRDIKKNLEEDLFIEYSHYEVVVKDEGLDPTTRLALESLDFSSRGTGDGGSSKTFESALRDLTPEEYAEKSSNWDHIQWELNRIIARAKLPHPIPGTSESKNILGARDTFFLSLSFPEVDQALPYVKSLCEENDAMEFRADLLSCRDDRFEVLRSLQNLRKYCRAHAIRAPGLAFGRKVIDDALPVVYTVRTAHQAGTWPDETSSDIRSMFNLLRLGLRNGVEVLDVESAWDREMTDDLLARADDYATVILGSHHLLQPTSMEHTIKLFHQCALDGRAHGAKLVLTIEDKAQDHMAIQGSDEAHLEIPTVSLILGEKGQYSRILNRNLTPTTHPVLPFVAAPGQLSAREIMERRISDGLLQKLSFVNLASEGGNENDEDNISRKMHVVALRACMLPHAFTEIKDIDDVDQFCKSEAVTSEYFGGATISPPHHQRSMVSHVDELTEAAKAIGYVDTIIPMPDHILKGDNSDWRGFYMPLKRLLGTGNDNDDITGDGYALILGSSDNNKARAAVYAAKQLGLKLIYHDADDSDVHTDAIKQIFPDAIFVSDLSAEHQTITQNNIKTIISTTPAMRNSDGSNLQQWMLRQKPIVCDANVKPYYSSMLFQAERSGCDVVRGSEMAWESGAARFESWMGRNAPYKVMKSAVLDECLHKGDEGLESSLMEEAMGEVGGMGDMGM